MSYNKKFKAVTHTLKGIYISCSLTHQSCIVPSIFGRGGENKSRPFRAGEITEEESK